MVRTRPDSLCFAPVFAALVACAACGGSATPSFLRIAHEGQVVSLDPRAAGDTITHSVLSNVYDSLVDYDPQMRLVPRLAVSWSAPADDVWVLELRSGVLAHDGRPFTAEDVRASLLQARDEPDSEMQSRVWPLEEVEVVDASHVRLRTRGPDPLLLYRLATVLMAPQRTGAGEGPVGTGPYRFVRRDASGLEVEAFAAHWAGAPAVQRLRFVTVEPGEPTLRALARGEADVLRWVPESQVERVSRLPGVRVVDQPSLRAVYLWLDSLPHPGLAPNPLADRRVRQALSLAIDRRALTARLARWAQPLHQFIPPGISGHDADLPELPFDPGRARELLREAGHPQGLDLTLTHGAGAGPEALAVQAALAEAGIRVTLEKSDWPSMHGRWRAGRLPLFLASWRFESGEASLFLQECVLSRRPGSLHSWNRASPIRGWTSWCATTSAASAPRRARSSSRPSSRGWTRRCRSSRC
jgi:peptide/nickel transport system substrate-binding protein